MARVKISFEDLLDTFDHITVCLRKNGKSRTITAEVLNAEGAKEEYVYITDSGFSWMETILYLEVIFLVVEIEAKRWSLGKTLGIRLKGRKSPVSLKM
ncbi:MAG: hypothetical protein AAF693_12875 [Bacteroidota bacterium]